MPSETKQDRSQLRSRGAFTLVETCISLVVIAMVLGAAAAFAVSMGQAWDAGATTDPVSGQKITAEVHVIASLASLRLENELSSQDCAGGWYGGSLTDPTAQQAELMLWNNANNDPTMTSDELELIQYDQTNHMLVKYVPPSTPQTLITNTNFNDPTWIATFRATCTEVPLARFVDGVQFNVQNPYSNTQKPLVEYQLKFVRNGVTTMRYGAICLRAPSTPPGQTLD